MQVNPEKVILWTARIIAAVIMLQTLFFKFTGAEESIFIFQAIGMEPWGRYGVGVMELIASILLLVPTYSWAGAGLGVGLMAGAIVFHLTILGIDVGGDDGYLFGLALVAGGCCLFVLWSSREQLRMLIRSL